VCIYVAGGHRERSLTLLSSIVTFEESPGLFIYQAGKHSVLGLLRALRLHTPHAFDVRVNAVCPRMTLTGMVTGIEGGWKNAGVPVNIPEDIANVVIGLPSASPTAGPSMFINVEGESGSGKKLEGAFNTGGYAWGEAESKGNMNGRAIYVEVGGLGTSKQVLFTQSRIGLEKDQLKDSFQDRRCFHRERIGRSRNGAGDSRSCRSCLHAAILARRWTKLKTHTRT
jgi:hypothetical protein